LVKTKVSPIERVKDFCATRRFTQPKFLLYVSFRYLVFKEQLISVVRFSSPYFSGESYLITSYYFISSRNFLEIPVLKCGFGGAKRDRTADLLLARQALSQLSYGPKMG
jgi:hypothetical protein